MAMMRHSSRMDSPGDEAHVKPPGTSSTFPCGFASFTVQHVSLGVCKTQSAGLQHVRRSDGRIGDRHAAQTQHLETTGENPGISQRQCAE